MEKKVRLKNRHINFKEKGFVQFFRGLVHEESLIRLFDRKGFYSSHGDNAMFIANEFHNSTKGIKYWGSGSVQSAKRFKGEDNATNKSTTGQDPLAYLYIREGMEFISLLKFLLFKKHCRIELWTTPPKDTTRWILSKKASPGNVEAFEEWLDNAEDLFREAILTMAVQIHSIRDSTASLFICLIKDCWNFNHRSHQENFYHFGISR